MNKNIKNPVSTGTMQSLAESSADTRTEMAAETPANANLTDGATASSTIESAKNESATNAPDNKQSRKHNKNSRKHNPLTQKEIGCFALHPIIRDYVLDCLHDGEEEHIHNKCVYYTLVALLRKGDRNLSANLAFICSKLNCQTESDLAEVLHFSKSTIHVFLNRVCWFYGCSRVTPAALARDWENSEDK